jgi:hypothetical protein
VHFIHTKTIINSTHSRRKMKIKRISASFPYRMHSGELISLCNISLKKFLNFSINFIPKSILFFYDQTTISQSSSISPSFSQRFTSFNDFCNSLFFWRNRWTENNSGLNSLSFFEGKEDLTNSAYTQLNILKNFQFFVWIFEVIGNKQ